MPVCKGDADSVVMTVEFVVEQNDAIRFLNFVQCDGLAYIVVRLAAFWTVEDILFDIIM